MAALPKLSNRPDWRSFLWLLFKQYVPLFGNATTLRRLVAALPGSRVAMSNLGDYQSAIQLVVGANLAFFTFPEWRQPSLPELETEAERWSALARNIAPTDVGFDGVKEGELAVRAIGQRMEKQLRWVRNICLAFAAGFAVLLLWSCHEATRPIAGIWLDVACVSGGLPVLLVAWINHGVSRKLETAGDIRRQLGRALR